MAITKPNSILVVAFFLLAMATIGSSTLLTPINQAIINGTGLTCSSPSPFPFKPILSGATVSVTCFGASATTTTNAFGSFSLTLNFPPPPPTVLGVLVNCLPVITVPANCTIIRSFQKVTTLQSIFLNFQYIYNSAGITGGQFNTLLFI